LYIHQPRTDFADRWSKIQQTSNKGLSTVSDGGSVELTNSAKYTAVETFIIVSALETTTCLVANTAPVLVGCMQKRGPKSHHDMLASKTYEGYIIKTSDLHVNMHA
jgi:hypothetical protein